MFNKRARPESSTDRRVRMDRQDLRARNEYLATARASLLNITRLRQERLARASAKLKLVSERGRI